MTQVLFLNKGDKSMFRIELNHWKDDEGFTFSETFDNIEEYCTAEEYINSYDGDLTPEDPNEAIQLEVYSENNVLLSIFWLQKDY